MKVVLTQDIRGTGEKGDIVEVSSGYARNYLLPRNMAVEATKANMNAAIAQARTEAHKQAQHAKDAKELAQKLDGIKVTIKMRVGEGGKLFGSVTNQDIAAALKEQHNIELERKRIVLDDAIRSTGEFEAELKLHQDVSTSLKVEVLPEETE